MLRSPYNYTPRRLGSVSDVVKVDVVDTSVDNMKNNISVNSSAPSKSFYTNSDVPVSLFGPGLTASPYDPIRHRAERTANAAAGARPDAAAPSQAAAQAATAQSTSNAETVKQ